MPTTHDILTMPREELKKLTRSEDFNVEDLSMGADMRLSVYTRPIPAHQYVLGSDFAYGIEGRDFDYAVILDKNTDPVEQVAELEGRWGHDRYDRLLYVMARYYFNAFVVGERQVGLPVLRSLVNNFDYGYLYYERNEATKARRRMDILGHHKQAGDPLIPQVRRAIRDHQLCVRSERLLGQIQAYQFRPKGRDSEKTEDMRDADLVMGAPSGEFDDGLNALAYAWKGILEVHRFEDQRPIYAEGSAGADLGMAKALQLPPRKPQRHAFKGYEK